MRNFFSIISSFFYKTPYIILFITARCNARCKMCFYWKSIETTTNELTLEEFSRIADKAGNVLHLSLSGGEPFIRKDIEDICYLFYWKCNTRFITIPTNCLLPDKIKEETEKILLKCRDTRITIDLSLDGVGEVHDSVRGVKGNFEKVLETYKLLSKLREQYSNLKIGVNSVISTFTQDNIAELKQFVKDNMNISGHGFTATRGDARDPAAKDVPIDILRDAFSFKPQKKLSLYQRFLEARYSLVKGMTIQILEEGKMPINCLAGEKMVIISENGKVYPCEILGKPLGDLRENDYDLKRILNSQQAKDVIKFIRDKKCHCTFECALSNAMIYDTKNHPALLKQMWINWNTARKNKE